jgi:hypothetical protein
MVRSFGDRADANLVRAREQILVVGRWAAGAAVGVLADETRQEDCCWLRPGALDRVDIVVICSTRASARRPTCA